MTRLELESALEDRCVAKVEAAGGMALKLRPPTGRGFPDRFIILRGRVWAVEFKRPKKGIVAAQQNTWRRLLTLAGLGVYFIDDDVGFDEALAREMGR